MAVISLAPIRVDASAIWDSRASAVVSNDGRALYFEFLFLGNVYLVLVDNGRQRGGVWKSTDDGLSFTRLDTANEPATSAINSNMSAFDPATGTIYIVYVSGGNTICAPFYCAGGTPGGDVYGTRISGAGTYVAGAAQLGFLSTGTVRLVWGDLGVGDVLMRDFAAGAWGAISTIATIGTGSNDMGSSIVDASDRMWILANVINGAVFEVDIFYIDSGGTASTPDTISGVKRGGTGNAVIDGNAVTFPYISSTFGDPSRWIPVAIRGTPLSAPAWTVEQVDPGMVAPQPPTIGTADYPTIFLDKDGHPTYLWVIVDNVNFDDPDELWMVKRIAGVWGTPVLFFDAIANPPADGATGFDQFIHTGQGLQLPNGNYIFITALETIDPITFEPDCTGFALITQTAPPPSSRFPFPEYIKRANMVGN